MLDFLDITAIAMSRVPSPFMASHQRQGLKCSYLGMDLGSGPQKGRERREEKRGRKISVAGEWLMESPVLSVRWAGSAWDSPGSGLHNHSCVHLLGRVLHLCFEPFAVWDSAHYCTKPTVIQQPSIMWHSRVPWICQEIKRLLGLLWLPIHEPFWLETSHNFPLLEGGGSN